MTDPFIQIMVPVYNEGSGILLFYEALTSSRVHFDDLKFVYDMDEDTSLPYIYELSKNDNRIGALKNTIGRGVVNALRMGFMQAKPGPFIVLMADNSDKFSIIPDMISLWKGGCAVVVPSRYMEGGKQHGGPLFKKFLSGLSGKVLNLVGFPTSDPTNNFKLYDGEWLSKQTIESDGGFEVALELTGKAFCQGLKIRQLPTEWWDRTQGQSNFKLWKWLPKYLRWYLPLLFITPIRKLKIYVKKHSVLNDGSL